MSKSDFIKKIETALEAYSQPFGKTVWKFEKVDGSWRAKLSGEFLFFMETTHGVPMDVMVEYINNMPAQAKLVTQIKDWQESGHVA